MKQKKILLVLTGGTICSFADERGENDTNTEKAKSQIVFNFRRSDSPYRKAECIRFESVFPLNVLSENMTPAHWDRLLSVFRSTDPEQYDGVILLHGTDTLAYTAALLSVFLSGYPIPVMLVSSQRSLQDKTANGNENFRAAVELIAGGILPNVYAVYRNEESGGAQTVYLHKAAHLLPCANHSDNFYSKDMIPLHGTPYRHEGTRSSGTRRLWQEKPFLLSSARVLRILPYVGLDYSLLKLDGVDAVVHGSFHSGTAATDPALDGASLSDYSLMHFKARCDAKLPPIPLFLEPYSQTKYVTTGNALRGGVVPVASLTGEMAYVKVLLGCAMGLRGKELCRFVDDDLNGEHLS